MVGPGAFLLLLLAATSTALKYDPAYLGHNLNQNKSATHPVDYWGEWEDHEFTPSPEQWRFPFYTLFLDKFVNGDPSNDNINGTYFEHDIRSNQIRHGGDVQGLVDSLDYLQGMGIKVSGGGCHIRSWIRRLTRLGYLHSWLGFHQPALGCRQLLSR